MIAKRLPALLLALVMMLSLAACGSGDSQNDSGEKAELTSDKETKEGGEDQSPAVKDDYNVIIDAMQAFYDNPSIETLAVVSGGTLVPEEEAALRPFELDRNDVTVEELRDGMDWPVTVTAAQQMNGDDLLQAQKRFEALKDDLQDEADSLREEAAAMSDADWKDAAERLDMSVTDAKAYYQQHITAIENLRAAILDSSVTHGWMVAFTGENGTDYFSYVCFCGDKWFSDSLYDG